VPTLKISPAALAPVFAGLVAVGASLSPHVSAKPVSRPPSRLAASLPLAFEPNLGQTARGVNYVSRGNGYTLFLTPTEAVLRLRTAPAHPGTDWGTRVPRSMELHARDRASLALRMQFVGANPAAAPSSEGALAARASYFTPGAPAGGLRDVPMYSSVRYSQVYPGVDLVYYGRQRELEYDLVVAPGADPTSIRMRFAGAETPQVTPDGELALQVGGRAVRLKKPELYQEENGTRTPVSGEFALLASGEVGFEVGPYDRDRRLVIDPVLIYSTLLGGSGFDAGTAVTVNAAGNAYVAGNTDSLDFPVVGAGQAVAPGNGDVFVVQLSPDGGSLVYATYLGGSDAEAASGIQLDALGNAYVAGTTASNNFPVAGAFQTAFNGGTEGFVAKLAPDGASLVYSTYLGGKSTDGITALALDAFGSAYVTGYTASNNFPIINGAIQPAFSGDYDAFVTRFDPTGARLVFSTYLGGADGDSGRAIVVDNLGDCYVSGNTDSGGFPINPGSVLPVFRGGRFGDVFISKITSDGSGLPISTFVGGSGSDSCGGVGIDVDRNIYVGFTTDSDDAKLANPVITQFQPARAGGESDGFLTKLNAEGNNVVWDTYLGGGGRDTIRAVGVDRTPNPDTPLYVFGDTDSEDFPTLEPLQAARSGGTDLFLTKIHPATILITPALVLDYSTYLGGTGDDHAGGMYVDVVGNIALTGGTNSINFPEHRGLPKRRGRRPVAEVLDAFVLRVLNGNFVPGGQVSVKTVLNFGNVPVTRPKTLPLTIRNNSSTNNLAVRIAPPPAPYSLPSGLLSLSIAPRSTFTVPIRFAPAGGGQVLPHRILRVLSSDPARPEVGITLQGKGIVPRPPSPGQ
jgi:hypothetical protein